jgi:hypothetical protein
MTSLREGTAVEMDYYRSYTVDQVAEYTEAFAREGFVVVDGVLSEEECHSSFEEVMSYLREHEASLEMPWLCLHVRMRDCTVVALASVR